MSRLRKVVFHPKTPVRRPTEEELKEFDEYWDTLCNERLEEPDDLTEALKDPKRRSAMCIDYSGNLSYKDFYRRLMNGDYTMTDRKDLN